MLQKCAINLPWLDAHAIGLGPIALAVCIGVLGFANLARADDAGNGLYGRFNGDTALSVGAGGGMLVHPEAQGLALLEFRARQLDAAGVVISPEWRTSGDWVLHAGVEVRPLFFWRFFTNRFSGNAFVDLWLDSIGLELGASGLYWESEQDRQSQLDFGLLLGAGFDLPLSWSATGGEGWLLHVGTRYVHALASDRGAPPGGLENLTVHLSLNYKWNVSLWSHSTGARYR